MDQFGGLDDGGVISSKLYLFVGQIITLFTIVLISLINISLNTGDQKLWITLLSMSLGCILPTPKFSSKTPVLFERANSSDIKTNV